MLRLLVSLVVVALATTSAVAKPAAAVLGIEVTGDIDQPSTKTARELTEGLRSRAKSAAGPFMLAPNSDRELIDEKVLKDCTSEAPACMAVIGRELGAEVLVYGKLERDGGGYRVKLAILDVKKKKVVKRETVDVPQGANGDEVRRLAKEAYVELTDGAVATGTLVVKTNVTEGTLFIDDEARDAFVDGSVRISLPTGRFRVAIEAEGYRREELTVKIEEDETTTETLKLGKVGGGGDDDDGGGRINVWKPVFGVSLTLTLAVGGYSLYAFLQQQSSAKALPLGSGLSDANCADDALRSTNPDLDSACSWNAKHTPTAWIAGATGVLTAVAGYLAYVRKPAKPTDVTTRRGAPRPAIAITPALSPHGGGATLRIDW